MMKHTIPRLYAEDALITYQGMSLTIRQFLCLIAGGLISLNLWMLTTGLAQFFWCRVALVLLPCFIAILFGWGRIKNLPVERFLFAWLRYHFRSQLYLYTMENDYDQTR